MYDTLDFTFGKKKNENALMRDQLPEEVHKEVSHIEALHEQFHPFSFEKSDPNSEDGTYTIRGSIVLENTRSGVPAIATITYKNGKIEKSEFTHEETEQQKAA